MQIKWSSKNPYHTCSWIAKESGAKPFVFDIHTLANASVNLRLDGKNLLFNRLKSDHLHEGIQMYIVSVFKLLLVLPLRFGLRYFRLLILLLILLFFVKARIKEGRR